MGNKINSVHDKFIRTILADKNVAKDYFQNYLPSFVASKLDFSTLTQLPDTYLSKELQKTMSDIVYSCKKLNSEDEVKVSLLVEHKSFPDRHTAVQIGGYIFSGLQKQIDNKEKLSIIIPVLLYHGRGKWEYQTLSNLFKNLETGWNQYVPDFDYIYNNLGVIPDETVEALNNKFLVASLLSLKYSFQKDWLEQNLRRILILAADASMNLQKSLTVYLFNNSGSIESKILELLEILPITLKETVMSTADIFVEKGKKIGILEGVEIGTHKTSEKIVRNLIKTSDLTDNQIALAADVSVDFVVKIRAEIRSAN